MNKGEPPLCDVIADHVMAECEGEHKHAYAVGRLSAYIANLATMNKDLMNDLIRVGIIPKPTDWRASSWPPRNTRPR